MEYETIEHKRGKILFRDGTVDDIKGIVLLYKRIFLSHSIFQQDDKKAAKYLKGCLSDEMGFGGIIVGECSKDIVGGIVIKNKSFDTTGKHCLFKYNHIGVHCDFLGGGVGSMLMKAADTKVMGLIRSGKIKTLKIELDVSERTSYLTEFYKKRGFIVEGKLSSHYGHGEGSIVMGKELS